MTNQPAPELPSDIYAERALLGSLLIDSRLIPEVKIDSTDFFYVRHQQIYEAILLIHKRGEEVDDLVLIDELRRQGTLIDLGGPAGVTELMNTTSATIHFREYAAIVREKARQRKALKLASDLANAALSNRPSDAARVSAELQKLLTPESDPLADLSKYLFHASDLHKLPRVTWLIKGEIPKRGSVVVFGPSGVGKSFFVVDRAMQLAQKHSVVYVAAEGETGFAARVEAWRKHNNQGYGDLHFFLNVISLIDDQERNQFIKVIKNLMPELIIVDTMSLCMLPGDENSTRDMGLLMKACKAMRMELDCATLLVHHTGKEGRTERGNSALRANSDVMIRLTGNDDQVIIECSKVKDLEPFTPWYAKILPVDAGEFQSAVLVPIDQIVYTPNDSLTPNQRLIIETLSQSIYINGASWADLKEGTGIAHGSLQRVISRLIDLGLVETSGKPAIYQLTEKGQKKTEKPKTPPSGAPGAVEVVHVSLKGK